MKYQTYKEDLEHKFEYLKEATEDVRDALEPFADSPLKYSNNLRLFSDIARESETNPDSKILVKQPTEYKNFLNLYNKNLIKKFQLLETLYQATKDEYKSYWKKNNLGKQIEDFQERLAKLKQYSKEIDGLDEKNPLTLKKFTKQNFVTLAEADKELDKMSDKSLNFMRHISDQYNKLPEGTKKDYYKEYPLSKTAKWLFLELFVEVLGGFVFSAITLSLAGTFSFGTLFQGVLIGTAVALPFEMGAHLLYDHAQKECRKQFGKEFGDEMFKKLSEQSDDLLNQHDISLSDVQKKQLEVKYNNIVKQILDDVYYELAKNIVEDVFFTSLKKLNPFSNRGKSYNELQGFHFSEVKNTNFELLSSTIALEVIENLPIIEFAKEGKDFSKMEFSSNMSVSLAKNINSAILKAQEITGGKLHANKVLEEKNSQNQAEKGR